LKKLEYDHPHRTAGAPSPGTGEAMNLAEELAQRIFPGHHIPSRNEEQQVYRGQVMLAINEALERAAQECEKQQQSETCCAERIRALKGQS